jgi:hypothetical protein
MVNMYFKTKVFLFLAIFVVFNVPLFAQEAEDLPDDPIYVIDPPREDLPDDPVYVIDPPREVLPDDPIYTIDPPREDLPDDPVYVIDPPREVLPDDQIYIINSFAFKIDGYTRPFALIYKGDLVTGEEIRGLSNLEKYVQDKTQILYNERVLESVNIEYFIRQMRGDGKYPVDLVIYAKDTWNIVAIPRPRYDSNSGFDITIKARDYNFLGTMNALRLDLGYTYDEEGRSSFLFMLDSNIPFRLFGLNWNLKSVNDFYYRPDVELPFYYKNTSGLSVEIPFKHTVITTGFNEMLYLNEENPDSVKYLYGDFQEGLYMSSNPYISWRIPFGFEVGQYGELAYTPTVQAVFYHEFSRWPLTENRKGPLLSFYHSLGFSRIDWIDNFLRGYSVVLLNSNSFAFYNIKNDLQAFIATVLASATGHFIFTDFFGVSTRLMYRQFFFFENGYENAGDVLRGILDKDIRADFMFSLNLDLNFKALRFKPSIWFNNQKLRLFDFDLHLIPIIDAAIGMFYSQNILLSGGCEIIIFPDFFRSLFLRISFGLNLSEYPGKNKYELFFGTELHY